MVLALIVIVAWFARGEHALEPLSGRERLRARELSEGIWSDLGLSLARGSYARKLRSDVLRERARRLLENSGAPTSECIPILEAARAILIGPGGVPDRGRVAIITIELAQHDRDLGRLDLAAREVHALMRFIGGCSNEIFAIELSACAHLFEDEVAAARGDREAEKAWRTAMN